MDKYIIIPGCSDLNRGDQALVWETKRLAEESGFKGQFYLTSEKNEPVEQSKNKGLKIITPILEHPSRKFKNKENIKYTKTLKIKWGIVAVFDLIESLLILWKPTRNIIKKMMNKQKVYSLKTFEQAEAIFMKGGGLLQTYGGLASTYSMYFWVYPILLAHKLKKPVYVMPNSFGPFEGPFVKKIAKAALKKCKVLTSRETISQKMVEEQLHIPITNYPDLAFTLPMSDMNKKDILTKYNIPNDKPIVALTMRPYRFPEAEDSEKAYKTFKKEMAIFIEWLYDHEYMPVIIEHTLAVNAHENDGACIKEVTNLMPKEKYRIVSDTKYDCYDLKCIYSFCDYIIGTRFHSVIFSFGSDVPGIAIAYTGNKSQGIMHDIGLDDYVVNIGDVSSKILITKFKKLINEKESVRDKISKYREHAEDARQSLIKACHK